MATQRPNVQIRENAYRDFEKAASRHGMNLVDMFEVCLLAFTQADGPTRQAAIDKQIKQRPPRKRRALSAA